MIFSCIFQKLEFIQPPSSNEEMNWEQLCLETYLLCIQEIWPEIMTMVVCIKKCVFAHSPGLTRVHLFKLLSKKMILFEAAVKSQYGYGWVTCRFSYAIHHNDARGWDELSMSLITFGNSEKLSSLKVHVLRFASVIFI